MALSRFGLSWEHFLDLSPKEFYDALKDDNERKEQEIKVITRSISETIRMQTILLMNISGKSLKKDIDNDVKMKKVFPFSWDQEETQTIGQMKTIMKTLAAAHKIKRTTSGRRKR